MVIDYKTNSDDYSFEKHGDWIDLNAKNVVAVELDHFVDFDRCIRRIARKNAIYPKKGIYDGVEVEYYEVKKGSYLMISLDIAMKLPEGYEAIVAPRSSLFKNTGLLLTNSIGVIDNNYNGDDDIWQFPAYATKDSIIIKGERICQFRILKSMGDVDMCKTTTLCSVNRGGFGSSGVK